MILTLLAMSALGASTESMAPGNSLDGFTQVGRHRDHLYCQEKTLGQFNGNVCVHGKHGVMTDNGWWMTTYVADDLPRQVYAYHSADPILQSTQDFMTMNSYFLADGYELAYSHQEDSIFNVVLCKDQACFINSIELDARTGTSVVITIQVINIQVYETKKFNQKTHS